VISANFAIFLYLQMYFWGRNIKRLRGHIPWEGGWDTGVDSSLLRTPWLAKLARNFDKKVSKVNLF
jgi:hypothetical protein